MKYKDKNGIMWTQKEFNMLPQYFIDKMEIHQLNVHLRYIPEKGMT